MAYQGLTQCISDGKVSADICEKAYADAVQAQYRDGPRFDSLADCQAQYGYDQCHHVQTSSGGWFMPALAGFMIGRALSHNGYNYGYGYGYGGGFGQPLYRYSRGPRRVAHRVRRALWPGRPGPVRSQRRRNAVPRRLRNEFRGARELGRLSTLEQRGA